MKTFFGVLAALLVFVGITAGGAFYFGFLGNAYDSTVTKQHMDIERNNFKESKSYVEGMIQDLSQQKLQYDRATTEMDKTAILNYVNSEFANFDINKIEDPNLTNFLLKARGE